MNGMWPWTRVTSHLVQNFLVCSNCWFVQVSPDYCASGGGAPWSASGDLPDDFWARWRPWRGPARAHGWRRSSGEDQQGVPSSAQVLTSISCAPSPTILSLIGDSEFMFMINVKTMYDQCMKQSMYETINVWNNQCMKQSMYETINLMYETINLMYET